MLILSVSFQFQRTIPEGNPSRACLVAALVLLAVEEDVIAEDLLKLLAKPRILIIQYHPVLQVRWSNPNCPKMTTCKHCASQFA